VLTTFAQNTKMTAKKATIYFSGAELTHSVQVLLAQGENEITLEGLTPNIDINSLKINATNSVVVASSEFTTDYLTEKKSSDLVKQLQDSVDYCNAAIAQRTTAIKINTASLDLLKKAIETNLGGTVDGAQPIVKKTLSVAELTQQLDFYNSKATVLEKTIAADAKQKEELTKTLARVQNQLNQEQRKKGIYNGVLKLQLMASYATPSTITVSYFTQAASWTPFYDMIIADVTKPVQLKGKARVNQTTGIDWNKVSITLSTATPARTKDAPVFSPWFIDYLNANNLEFALRGKASGVSVQNSISYEEKEMYSLGYADVRKEEKAYAPQTPLYVIDGVPFDGDISQIDPASIQSTEVVKDVSEMGIYGARGAAGVVLITTKKMEDFITAEEKNISMEFAISLPYTIPGNGKEQIIDLKNYELTADYKYYAAPKLDASVFLIADFKDWENLNILPGMANITYDGTYVGQTFLNTSQANKILSVTLGTDKRVAIKREKLTDFSQVKTFGSETRVTLAYKITVKNNQNKPVKFTLKEPYPISKQGDIKVTLLDKDTTPSTFNNAEVGVLTWDFDLAVGESKEFRIAYEVRYPKDKKINLR
jgi:TonB-dependent SusC/RagA subfamily outer membrane receptor